MGPSRIRSTHGDGIRSKFLLSIKFVFSIAIYLFLLQYGSEIYTPSITTNNNYALPPQFKNTGILYGPPTRGSENVGLIFFEKLLKNLNNSVQSIIISFVYDSDYRQRYDFCLVFFALFEEAGCHSVMRKVSFPKARN